MFTATTSKSVYSKPRQDAEIETEPFEDLHELFQVYDNVYFSGMLVSSGVYVRWSSQMKACAGICRMGSGIGIEIALSEPLLQMRSSADFKETLLHEMIHALDFLQPNSNRDHDGHGDFFKKKQREINSSTVFDPFRPAKGYHITIYHSWHEEVTSHRVHHWQCSTCAHIIKRSMNRAPTEKDCRYYRKNGSLWKFPQSTVTNKCGDATCMAHNHLRKCPNGEWIKTTNPESKTQRLKRVNAKEKARRKLTKLTANTIKPSPLASTSIKGEAHDSAATNYTERQSILKFTSIQSNTLANTVICLDADSDTADEPPVSVPRYRTATSIISADMSLSPKNKQRSHASNTQKAPDKWDEESIAKRSGVNANCKNDSVKRVASMTNTKLPSTTSGTKRIVAFNDGKLTSPDAYASSSEICVERNNHDGQDTEGTVKIANTQVNTSWGSGFTLGSWTDGDGECKGRSGERGVVSGDDLSESAKDIRGVCVTGRTRGDECSKISVQASNSHGPLRMDRGSDTGKNVSKSSCATPNADTVNSIIVGQGLYSTQTRSDRRPQVSPLTVPELWGQPLPKDMTTCLTDENTVMTVAMISREKAKVLLLECGGSVEQAINRHYGM
eukprot:CFRG5614T1